jgi:hypothetical protein
MSTLFYGATSIDPTCINELEAFAVSTGIATRAMERTHLTPDERITMLNLADSLHWEECEHLYEGKPAPRLERFWAAMRLVGDDYEDQEEAFNQELERLLETQESGE